MTMNPKIKALFCGVAFVGAVTLGEEARADQTPYQLDVTWPGYVQPGTYTAICDNGAEESCVQGDRVTFTASYVRTNPTQARLDIDWSNTIINEDDVPWCEIMITCHDGVGGHTIMDIENWDSCSATNAYDQNPPGTDCDIADEIYIAVGVNHES